MRFLFAAALAATLSSAAWADETHHARNSCAGSEARMGAVSSEEILRITDDALRDALAEVESADLDAETSAEITAAISEAMATLEVDLATLDAHLDAMPSAELILSEAEEQRIDERVEAAVARVEDAVERMEDRLEGEADAAPKRWRPRY